MTLMYHKCAMTCLKVHHSCSKEQAGTTRPCSARSLTCPYRRGFWTFLDGDRD